MHKMKIRDWVAVPYSGATADLAIFERDKLQQQIFVYITMDATTYKMHGNLISPMPQKSFKSLVLKI